MAKIQHPGVQPLGPSQASTEVGNSAVGTGVTATASPTTIAAKIALIFTSFL